MESLEVADSLRNICLIQGYGDKWAEAEQTAREVLAIRRKLLGNKDPRVAFALEDLSWTLNARNKYEESQSLHTEALAMLQNLLGDSHPDVARNLDAQGQLLGRRGDLEGSEGLLRAALSIQRKLLGEEDQATVETLCSLAKTLHDRGKRSEAESTWREALTIGRKYWAMNHPDRLHALRGMCDTLEAEGKWSEAEALWRETLSFWRERGGIEDKESLNTLRRLGVCLECSKRWPEAESVYWEVLTISRKKGDEDPEVLVDLDRVARALIAQKKLGEAQHLLDGVLTQAFAAKPTSANLLILRVNVMARRGGWKEATADATLALEHQLTDHYRYHSLAALLAMAGDRPAYEQICKRMVTKFAESTEPYVAERVAQDCLLLPDSGADLAVVDKLADKAVTAGIGKNGLPYFQACKAMSHYRMGNFSEAITWGEKAAKDSSEFAQAKTYAVLAMAYWQLGRKHEALDALTKGDTLAPVFSPGGDIGESWVAWLMARVSLDEATKLIHAEPNAHDNANPP
jgi:tetratricopeptide (TPR) repeat protein